jgi:probable HAF family extracellular repeat protein
MKDLGTLGGSNSLARGITDAGQIVGSANLSGDTIAHAFTWTTKSEMQDLNNMIPPNSGWELYSANAVSENGQIVGDGVINGQTHAFLLTPASTASRF